MKITQRDRKILTTGGVFLVCYALYFFVAAPIYKKQTKAHDKIENQIQFIQKYYDVLNQKAYYQQKEKANKSTYVSLAKRFFKEKQPGLAAASLQKLVESFAGGIVAIERTRVNKPKYMERVLAVPIEISIRSNLKTLSLFLMKIENHEKFLIIEELQSRRINKTDPEALQTRLMITGFIQELEPQGGKKI